MEGLDEFVLGLESCAKRLNFLALSGQCVPMGVHLGRYIVERLVCLCLIGFEITEARGGVCDGCSHVVI